MEHEPPPPAIRVHRTVVLRVTDDLDAVGLQQLERILHDLIVDQGVADLLVDLSGAPATVAGVADVLAAAQEAVEARGGMLELRAPQNPPAEIVDLAEDIPTFTPLDEPS